MSHSIFKASPQPSQHGSPLFSHSNNLTYHLPSSFSPKSKEDSSRPDNQKTITQTRIKKLSFLLNPNGENLLKSEDDPAPNVKSIVSFHTPSRSLGETKKFIQLKGSASSSQLSFDFFNSKDLVRLAMNKAKSKETGKKERVRTPNNISTAFKKPQSLHLNSSVLVSDKEASAHRFLSPTDSESIGFRGSRPPTGDKAAKVRRLHQIYNEGSPGDRARQTQSNIHALSQDLSHQLFHHSLSPTNQPMTKLLSPGNAIVKMQSQSQRQSNRAKANQEQGKRHKGRDDDGFSKTPNIDTSSERLVHMKKLPAHHLFKHGSSPMNNKVSSLPGTPPMKDMKDRGRSPNSKVRRIKLPFENSDGLDAFGRKMQDSRVRKDGLAELENAVNNLVRTCEQSLEPLLKTRGAAEKVKQAQYNVLDRIRGLSRNDEGSQTGNMSTVLREKKSIEGELHVVKQENERLRHRMKEMCQRYKANKMKESQNKGNMSGKVDEYSDTERTSTLKKVIEHQQLVIQDLRKKENVTNKVLDLIRKTGLDIDDFSSSNNNIEEGDEVEDSLQALSMSDVKKEKMTESQKIDEEPYQWDLIPQQLQEGETEREEEDPKAASYIKVENESEGIEEWKVECDDKMISGIRESEDESVRQKIIKHTYSDAKSTADSVGLSTRKLTKGRRSMSIKMKSKLKLDLTRVTGSVSVPKYNIVSGQSSSEKFMLNFPAAENGQGFHEEFMSRFEEFSQSWRQAALHQKF